MTIVRSQPALRLTVASVDLAAAIDAFLSQPDLASTTRAKYRQTLTVVEDELGDAPVTGSGLAGVVEQRWHHASAATWNRHVATVRSFARYCERTRILAIDGAVELARRAEKHDHTRSIPMASLQRLWVGERKIWIVPLTRAGALAILALADDTDELVITRRTRRALQRCTTASQPAGRVSRASDPSRGMTRRSPRPHWRHYTSGAVFDNPSRERIDVPGIGWCVRVRVNPRHRHVDAGNPGNPVPHTR